MAFKTGKRKKKKDKTGNQSEKNSKLAKPEVKDEVPEDLQSIIESSEEKLVIKNENAKTPNIIQPPAPITLSGKDKNILRRPTRLPPHFKKRMSFDREKGLNQTPATKAETIKSNESKIESQKHTGPIKPPVTRRKRADTIPRTTQLPEQKVDASTSIAQARQIHQQIQAESQIVSQPSERQEQKTKKQQNILISQVHAQELILPQFNPKTILNRPQTEGWPWVTSKTVNIPRELQTFWRAEASLYSAIALLEMYTRANDRGEIAPEVYHKQLKSALMETIQLRFKLEKDKRFQWSLFVQDNQIEKLYPQAFEKLLRIEGSSDIDKAIKDQTHRLDYQEMVKLPTKAADYVANAIELMDLIRLQSVATIERLIPLLEDLRKILQQTSQIVSDDYWAIKEINAWIQRLYQESPGTIPSEEELGRLEMQVVRWLNDFRRELKNL